MPGARLPGAWLKSSRRGGEIVPCVGGGIGLQSVDAWVFHAARGMGVHGGFRGDTVEVLVAMAYYTGWTSRVHGWQHLDL